MYGCQAQPNCMLNRIRCNNAYQTIPLGHDHVMGSNNASGFDQTWKFNKGKCKSGLEGLVGISIMVFELLSVVKV